MLTDLEFSHEGKHNCFAELYVNLTASTTQLRHSVKPSALHISVVRCKVQNIYCILCVSASDNSTDSLLEHFSYKIPNVSPIVIVGSLLAIPTLFALFVFFVIR